MPRQDGGPRKPGSGPAWVKTRSLNMGEIPSTWTFPSLWDAALRNQRKGGNKNLSKWSNSTFVLPKPQALGKPRKKDTKIGINQLWYTSSY
ncbi:uncharacterized protein ACIQIH_011610 isoform 2-T2 [Cyanocitta cristata]